MQVVNVSELRATGFPNALISAQRAINLPEVQEMLIRLSEYNLGIFMPHAHDEFTGDFQELPTNVVQVESGLEVSFQTTEQIASLAERFLPVAWRWHDGAPTLAAVCEMAQACESDGNVQHKMPIPKNGLNFSIDQYP